MEFRLNITAKKKVHSINIKHTYQKIFDNHFHALTNTNYRYFWLGQVVSLIGTWMQYIGQVWLVYTLTDSPLLLGVLGAMQFLPITFLSLFAGVFIDRFPKRSILILTQSVSMILALILATLSFMNAVQYSYVLVLAVLLGITNAIDMPARQSFMIEIAGREDLMNAIALNSVTFNLAKIIGPSIGAVVMSIFGAGWCFLINGLSFLAVIYGLSRIKVTPYVREKRTQNVLSEIIDGLKYIYQNKILLQTILMISTMGILAFNYNVLIPVFVKNVLHQDASAFGILMAALGMGSLIGAFTISSGSNASPKLKIMGISGLIIGLFYFLNGLNSLYIISFLLLVVTGIFSIYFTTTANTTLQINSNDTYRGRVMSVYSLVFAGAAPIGSLFSGAAINSFGVSAVFKLSGILLIILTLLILWLFRYKTKIPDTLPV